MDKPIIMDECLPNEQESVDSNSFFLDTKRKLRLVLSNTNSFHLVLKKVRLKINYVDGVYFKCVYVCFLLLG